MLSIHLKLTNSVLFITESKHASKAFLQTYPDILLYRPVLIINQTKKMLNRANSITINVASRVSDMSVISILTLK